jgi:hypothetical protein
VPSPGALLNLEKILFAKRVKPYRVCRWAAAARKHKVVDNNNNNTSRSGGDNNNNKMRGANEKMAQFSRINFPNRFDRMKRKRSVVVVVVMIIIVLLPLLASCDRSRAPEIVVISNPSLQQQH